MPIDHPFKDPLKTSPKTSKAFKDLFEKNPKIALNTYKDPLKTQRHHYIQWYIKIEYWTVPKLSAHFTHQDTSLTLLPTNQLQNGPHLRLRTQRLLRL